MSPPSSLLPLVFSLLLLLHVTSLAPPSVKLPPTVLVIGSTGKVGRRVVAELLSRSVTTRALTRDVDRARSLLKYSPDLHIVKGDVTKPGEWLVMHKECDAQFSRTASEQTASEQTASEILPQKDPRNALPQNSRLKTRPSRQAVQDAPPHKRRVLFANNFASFVPPSPLCSLFTPFRAPQTPWTTPSRAARTSLMFTAQFACQSSTRSCSRSTGPCTRRRGMLVMTRPTHTLSTTAQCR